MEVTGVALRVFGEKVTQVLRSQLIKRLEDHNPRLITNGFSNGLPQTEQQYRSWGSTMPV